MSTAQRPARPGSPFSDVRPDVVAAACAAALALVWVSVDGLPAGRWLAVHLFTLGVITPLIVAFSQHQAETILHVPGRSRRWLRVALVGGAAVLAGGMVWSSTPVIGAGSTAIAAAVLASWWRLRKARKRSLGARFTWVVRGYERAHGAFLHGALLGALLGLGLIPGTAYIAFRIAHLHAMVLGFAAVTLLSTVVLYGPTLLRAQLEPGADVAGSRWVRRIATAATVGVLALLLSALPDPYGVAARLVAAVAIGMCAVGAGGIVVPLIRTVARRGRRAPAPGMLLTAAVTWLVLGIAGDAVLVASGAWHWLDPLGAVVLVGGFAQAIAATLLHVVASWLPRQRRLAVRGRLDSAPPWVVMAPQLGVAALGVAVLL